MAGVMPKKSTSGRKQWTLHGNSRTSLKRLRGQLASDGCPESQVVLAKQLLDEQCEFKCDEKENARLGVYWLIKASEQGNLEATDLLKSCLQTGKGVSEHNYMDVKMCISMSQDEKIVRRAAREMFASLSNGADYITSNQLQRKILAIDRGEGCSKSTETRELNGEADQNEEISNGYEDTSDSEEETDWSRRSDNIFNEKLTEDNVVSAAVTFSHGQLPEVNNILCLIEPNLRALDHIPFVYRTIVHPRLSFSILYYKLMKFLGEKTLPFFFPLAKSEVQLVVFMFLYAFINSQNLLYFLPTLIFYFTFIIMVVSTFQMLQSQRELHDYRLWTGLFICYSNGGLNEQSFETQFLLNHRKPFCWYFFSLLVHYFCYPITPVKSESEFTIIAFCLTFMTLLGLMPKRRSKAVFDSLVLLSFAVNVLARYPYDTDPIVSRGWRYLELNVPSFPSYVVGNGIEFCINFRLVLYAIIPLLLAKMALKDNWKGSYKVLLPHLVTLSWLQYFALCSHNATTYGFYRGILALVGLVFFLPLVGIMSVIIPVAALTKWVVTSDVLYTIGLFLVLLILCLGVCYLCAHTRYARYTALIQISLMFVAFFALLRSSTHRDNYDNEQHKVPEIMAWDVFQKFCHQPIWERENVAFAQIKCAELEGSNIFWDGYITDIKVQSINNPVKSFFDKFPTVLAQYFYCLYGKEIKADCNKVPENAKSDCVSFFETLHSVSKCTLKDYNVYTYEIKVKMQSSIWGKTSDVSLELSDDFKNFTLKRKPDDHVWFKGMLFNDKTLGSDGILGGFSPHVNIEEIGCLACQDKNFTEMKSIKRSFSGLAILNNVYIGFKFILNVMFNPLLIFN